MMLELREIVALLTACGSLGGLFWLRRNIFLVTVEGISMEPTFRAGERLVARRITLAGLGRGDVVILQCPDENLSWTGLPGKRPAGTKMLIKRVAALPGDVPPLDRAPALAEHQSVLVPANHLVVLGDNIGYSFDSKQIGYVPADRLMGVVLRRWGDPASVTPR